jgi:hypothetical protein
LAIKQNSHRKLWEINKETRLGLAENIEYDVCPGYGGMGSGEG